MKKVIILLSVCAAFAMTSCTLSTCKCTTHSTDPLETDSEATFPSVAGFCDVLNSSSTSGGFTTTVTCVEE